MTAKTQHIQAIEDAVRQAETANSQSAILFLVFKVLVTIALVLIEQIDD